MLVPTISGRPRLTIDGNFSDWVASERIDTPGNLVPSYDVFGTVQDGTYYISIQATVNTDPIIGPGTTIWLNTDQNSSTGYSPFGSIGAEYNITYVGGAFYLYSGAAAQNLISATPLAAALSPDGQSIEIAVPRSLLTPAGGPSPTNINIDAQIDTGTSAAIYLPTDYNNPEYTITDPATLLPQTDNHKIAIVYSDTSANLYFSKGAYSDLFMAVQNQARMAGVSYDLIDESQLTDIKNLFGYSELIFPSMPDVNTAQLPAIMSTLTSAVYNYHIGLITAGDFLTNDQTGAALPGNSYANMATLMGLARYTGGNSGSVTITANDVGNPIMKSYTAGQTIQTYTKEGYAAYQGVYTPTDVLVDQNVADVGTLPGVQQTETGGTNVHFATTDMEGDSNLLSQVIQSIVLGTGPGVALHISRDAGIVVARMDMDQSQFPADVSPDGGGPGIYDALIPILQQWKQQYDFVGSYYINVGDNPGGAVPSTTDWTKSLPYYKALLAMGGEIGNHSYTHMINPPTVTFTATTVGDTPAGSTHITLGSVPSFAGTTVSMLVTGPGLGTNTPLPGPAGDSGAVANTLVAGVSSDTIAISYVPAGFGGSNNGTIADIPAGTTLTFSIPALSTNFLQSGTDNVPSGVGSPFTFDYEFNQSKLIEQAQLGTIIYGAAIPGANETFATDQQILPIYQSAPATATSPGYTGYLTGGWTGIGSGYPSAFGYLTPSQMGSVYIAPNMTFDFTELQYQGKSIAQTEADWAAQFNSFGANAAGTPVVVWPIHDYGVAAWDTNTHVQTTSPSPEQPFTTDLFTSFVKLAANANYEFVTTEDLASRIAAQQKASLNYTTTGNTINITVTPDPTAPNLGTMALDVINGGSNVVQNVVNWYAYDAQELFLPDTGGSFSVNLGATQDDVTHIASLPMRGDLVSVTGDGLNLNFSMIGEGNVLVDLGAHGNKVPVVTGATIASLVGDQLNLTLTGLGLHNVALNLVQQAPTELVSTLALSADTGASATDFITQSAAQTISGTLSSALAAGDVVRLSLDNGVTWLTAASTTGATTFSLAGITLTGSGTLVARVENLSGMPSAALTQAYVLDQTPPAEAAAVVAMTDDSGVAGDFITNNGAAGRTVSGTLSAALPADETLQVSADGGTTWSSVTPTGTTWSTIDTIAHAVSWTIETRIIDLAGNIGSVTSQTVTLDTTPPAAPGAPDLTDASDTGVLNTDNLTSVTKPTFTGTGAEAGGTVTLLEGTTPIGTGIAAADGSWSASIATPLADGVHLIHATTTDLAGNVGPASPDLSITVDTTAPAAPSAPDLLAASDSGKSSTDNITNNTTPTFKGTAAASSTVTLYDGTTAIGSVIASAAGAWTIVASPLLDGVHNITARSMDAAGNLSVASAALAVTIDTFAVVPSTPDMTAATDKGVSSTDNITNDSTPTFTGTAEAGSAITLLDGTSVIGTANATAAGVWTIVSAALTDGVHSITATAKDTAGNTSVASSALAVTIDTATPAAPTAPDLIAASDTGASSTDNITSNTTPTFTGSAEAGATVTLLNGTTKVGTAIAGADGTWTITSSALGNGVRNMSAKATDVAGNSSVASAVLAVTIDTTIAAPSRPDLLAASDSGASNTDNITNVTTPSFTGTAEIGSSVTLFDGTSAIGTSTATATGTWTIVASPLTDGVHNITAKATDPAGNTSTSTALAVTIDTQPPSQGPTITAGSTTTLSGKGEVGATVTVSDGTTTIGTATVGAGTNWSMSFLASSLPRTLTATQTDKAGNANVGSSSTALVGTLLPDTLTGTAGNELLVGGAGADTFSFDALFGQDIIADFAAGGAAHDVINFHASAVLNSFANVLSHTTDGSSGAVISLDASNTITLTKVSKAALTSADFTFV